jgi:hypothetical protein
MLVRLFAFFRVIPSPVNTVRPPPITLSCVRLFHLESFDLSSLLRFSSSFSCVSSSFFARLRQLKGMALTGFKGFHAEVKLMSSISKMRVAFGGITGGYPRTPYA